MAKYAFKHCKKELREINREFNARYVKDDDLLEYNLSKGQMLCADRKRM